MLTLSLFTLQSQDRDAPQEPPAKQKHNRSPANRQSRFLSRTTTPTGIDEGNPPHFNVSTPQDDAVSDTALRLTASQLELPSTIPDSTKARMNALGSQSQGDTQPVSQWMRDEFTNAIRERQAAKTWSSWGRSTGGDSTSKTYLPGQTGHVDLLDAYEAPSLSEGGESIHEDLEDELGTISQVQDVRTELYPESKRFRQPTTPASHNNKRKRDVDITPQEQTTPGLPINPFAGQSNGVEGLMDSSQLFHATQAPSSPLAIVPSSDRLSERPSPKIYASQRPSTADATSSPIKHPQLNRGRAVTQPQTTYVSMKESQEERERRRLNLLREKSEALADLSDDGFESDESMLRRQNRRRKLELETRAHLSKITAQSRPSTSGRGRGRGRGRGKGPGLNCNESRTHPATATPSASKRETVLISDDPSPEALSNHSEEETEQEENAVQVNVSEAEDLAEENKENIDSSGVQVPMTVPKSKDRRHARALQRSPSNRRNRAPLETEEGYPRGTASSGSIEVLPKATPVLDVADSQPSNRGPPPLQINQDLSDKPVVPVSSPDSRFIVPQSQPSPEDRFSKRPSDNQVVRASDVEPDLESSSINVRSHPGGSSIKPHGQAPGKHPSPTRTDTEAANSVQSSTSDERSILYKQTSHHGQMTSEIPTQQYSTGAEVPRSENAIDAERRPTGKVIAISHQSIAARSTIPESTAGNHHSFPASTGNAKSVDQSLVSLTGSFGKNTKPSSSVPVSGKSTSFETAPLHIAATSETFDGVSSSPKKQPDCDSPIRQSSRLRTMAEIAAQPTPSDAIGSIDVDIDLMNGEDMEFHSIVSGCDPVAPPRKRRRGINGRPIQTDSPTGTIRSSSPLSSPPNEQLVGRNLTPPSPPIQAGSTAPEAPKMVAGNPEDPSMSKEIAPTVTDTKLQLPGTARKSVGRPKKLKLSGQQHISEGHNGNRAVTLQTLHQDDHHNDKSTETEGAESSLFDTIVAPNRVFAHFNGNCSGFYPATCIGAMPGEELRYKVRFDDGTIGSVSAYGVKQLELRPGDDVKIDMAGKRNKTYTVERLQGRQQPTTVLDPTTPSRRGRGQRNMDAQCPSTDVYGHDSVVVSTKQRQPNDKDKENVEQTVVPLEYIYLTSTLWSNFKDRSFSHTSGQANITSGFTTPSERTSSPSTPSTRSRRPKFLALPTIRPTMSMTAQNETVFDNMVFAITTIATEAKRNQTTQLIEQNGGRILASGFDELFDIPSVEVTSAGVPSPKQNIDPHFRLNDGAKNLGFTCLLADKHSRTSKYIQALALGIPCLSSRWIQDCVSKQRILPWDAYLLAAGEPAMLEGAVRSRLIQPFPADTAKLVNIIDNRPKLLGGMSVLLIMTKSEEKDMQNHPLLTHALGAAKVSRAASIEAAASTIAEGNVQGEAWDWVYSHGSERQAEKALFGDSSTGQKRKRGRVSDGAGEGKRPKIVGHEFVIQSLILGRLLDVD